MNIQKIYNTFTMKKFMFLALFAVTSLFVKAQESGYVALLVEAVGKTVDVNGIRYMKTNGQFVSLSEPYSLTPTIVPVYLKIGKVGAENLTEKIDSIIQKIMQQPIANPYIAFVRAADRKMVKKIRKQDDAKVPEAYIMENFGNTLTLEKFKEIQGGLKKPTVPVNNQPAPKQAGPTNPFLQKN